jgi:lipoprotein-anchoring transpeptidase ErfK/SrfK
LRIALKLEKRVRPVPALPATDGLPALPTSRRGLLLGVGGLLLTGCSSTVGGLVDSFTTGAAPGRPAFGVDQQGPAPKVIYASFTDGGKTLPAIPYHKLDRKFLRQTVADPTGEEPGTIVVRLEERLLYYVLPGEEAIRYGVGIGKDGFIWSGRARIQYKKEWPTWTPPAEMIERKPELAEFSNGQAGGLDNPLGARALYIYDRDQDTGYRVHGSPEWWTIGEAMSSGCVRMINQDVIDLYDRVSEKTPIVVT